MPNFTGYRAKPASDSVPSDHRETYIRYKAERDATVRDRCIRCLYFIKRLRSVAFPSGSKPEESDIFQLCSLHLFSVIFHLMVWIYIYIYISTYPSPSLFSYLTKEHKAPNTSMGQERLWMGSEPFGTRLLSDWLGSKNSTGGACGKFCFVFTSSGTEVTIKLRGTGCSLPRTRSALLTADTPSGKMAKTSTQTRMITTAQ